LIVGIDRSKNHDMGAANADDKGGAPRERKKKTEKALVVKHQQVR
jgi:hypothetical protein